MLGHAGLPLVLWHDIEVRDVFIGNLALLLMFHLGIDGFEIIFPEQLHLEALSQAGVYGDKPRWCI